MSLNVERPNRILKIYTQKPIPEFIKYTHVTELLIPTLEMAFKFLEEKIRENIYESETELQAVLDEWPEYCQEHDFNLPPDYAQLKVVDCGFSTQIVFCDVRDNCLQAFDLAAVSKKAATKNSARQPTPVSPPPPRDTGQNRSESSRD